jgi:glycerol-3-phosphate dehydrogenase (NAD(P)+)
MTEAMNVGVLGGGAWGQALARLILAAGHRPLIGYRDEKPPHLLPSTPQPTTVSETCDLLFVATSAAMVREAIRLARPGPRNRVVVAGRGLDPVSGDWLTDAVLQECDAVRVGALAGPAPVQEILNGGLCAGVVASRFDEVRAMAVRALHSSRYRCYDTPDLTGVQLAGAMMPILATLTGLAMSLGGAGVGLQAMVMTRGMAETIRLGQAIGADPTTFSGLAGMGDLVAVQARAGHPHYDAGAALARGQRDQGPVAIARAILSLAAFQRVEMPMTSALVAIYDGLPPIEAVGRLMARDATSEHHR